MGVKVLGNYKNFVGKTHLQVRMGRMSYQVSRSSELTAKNAEEGIGIAHCKKFAEIATERADKADLLAKAHEDMALAPENK
jgi:hypothetical protein